MVGQDKRKQRSCSFYVSDFHLEMILLPYIKEKIKKEEDITLLTQKNLRQTLEILVKKINLDEKIKQKILDLNWEGDKRIRENSNIIVIGSEEYIKKKNEEIERNNVLSIVDCYYFEEIKNNIINIKKQYKNILNSLGENNF